MEERLLEWVVAISNRDNGRSLVTVANIDCNATTMAITILSKDLVALHSNFFFSNSLVEPGLSQGKNVRIKLSDSGSKFVKMRKNTSNIGMRPVVLLLRGPGLISTSPASTKSRNMLTRQNSLPCLLSPRQAASFEWSSLQCVL